MFFLKNFFKKYTLNSFSIKKNEEGGDPVLIKTFSDKILGASSIIFMLGFIYLLFYFKYLPEQIPLWFSLPWGINLLSVKKYIFIIPFLNLLILCFAYYLYYFYQKFNVKEIAYFISFITLFSSLLLNFSLTQVINNSRLAYFSLGSWFNTFFIPSLLAFLITFISSKIVINYAKNLKIIEYPSLRKEPGKVLQKPTPRGGAIAFWIGFAITSLLFVGYSQRVLGLVLGTFITTLTGYLDDRLKLGYLSRLIFFMPLAILIVVLSGFIMLYIPNPFGNPIKLDFLRYTFSLYGTHSIVIWGALFAFIWIFWLSNMLSWNNGIDGQFVAISSVVALVIGLLSLRFDSLSYEQLLSAKIAFITFGAVMGLFFDTFPPQKIIWGFGATSLGLILGGLSLLSGTRVATASLVLILPSLDTLYVIFARIKNKKSPFKGDRNHFHHKLLDLGWSKRKIALFYWLVSITFGLISLVTSGKTKALFLFTFSGLVLFFIIFVRNTVSTYLKKTKKVAV